VITNLVARYRRKKTNSDLSGILDDHTAILSLLRYIGVSFFFSDNALLNLNCSVLPLTVLSDPDHGYWCCI